MYELGLTVLDPRYWFDIPHGGTVTTRSGTVLTRIYLASVLSPKGSISINFPEGHSDGKVRVYLRYGKTGELVLVWPENADAEDAFRQLLLALAQMTGLIYANREVVTPPAAE